MLIVFSRIQGFFEWREHCVNHISERVVVQEPSESSFPKLTYACMVDTGIVKEPGICPFCVWDSTLLPENRLRQYIPQMPESFPIR
jgi:hypothetical protein